MMRKSILYSSFICIFAFALNLAIGQTSIIEAIQQDNYLKVEELIKSGKNVNEVDPIKFNTPLIEASILGNDSIVTLLLTKGAKVNLCGIKVLENMSPLHAACIGGNIDIVKKLLDAGADIYKNDSDNDRIYLPINYASNEGFKDIVDYLKTKGTFENSIVITPNPQVKGIQELLYELNLYSGGVNGILDDDTRKSLKKYKEKYLKIYPHRRLSYNRVRGYFDFMDCLTDVYSSEKGCKKIKGLLYTEVAFKTYGCIIYCSSKRKCYDNNLIRDFSIN